MDDFLQNGPLFKQVLEQYYEPGKYTLILNGDVEELHRFRLRQITSFWKNTYTVFKRFHDRDSLFKLFGNHDYEILLRHKLPLNIPVHETLKLDYKGNNIFIFHGHQAGYRWFKLYHWITAFFLRFLANVLRIKNYTVAQNKRKKYKIEKNAYNFAKKNKIIVVIGHTHRPLYESLSKSDNLKFKIESLCREYPSAPGNQKQELEEKIQKYKKELVDILQRKDGEDIISNLYNSGQAPLVPCMFNSGCGIGKRGITAIEISEGKIRLVHWFDKRVSRNYLGYDGYPLHRLQDTEYCKITLKEDPLDYIFTRIKLLAD